MDITTLSSRFGAALAASTAIAAFCATNGYNEHTVVITTDLEALPEQQDYPVIAINAGRTATGKTRDEEGLLFAVGVGIYDEEAPIVTGKIRELEARKRLEQLRRLVVTEIAATDLDGGYIDTIDTEFEPVEYTGFYLANMEISVARPYVWRENRLI